QAALNAVAKVKFDENLAARFLGQWLTEPSAAAWFEPSDPDFDLFDHWPMRGTLKLDRCTRLMYRGKELYINGELAELPPGPALRMLADERNLDCQSRPARQLKPAELQMLDSWLAQGWLHYAEHE